MSWNLHSSLLHPPSPPQIHFYKIQRPSDSGSKWDLEIFIFFGGKEENWKIWSQTLGRERMGIDNKLLKPRPQLLTFVGGESLVRIWNFKAACKIAWTSLLVLFIKWHLPDTVRTYHWGILALSCFCMLYPKPALLLVGEGIIGLEYSYVQLLLNLI